MIAAFWTGFITVSVIVIGLYVTGIMLGIVLRGIRAVL